MAAREAENKLWYIPHPDTEILEVCEDCGGEPVCPECKATNHRGQIVTDLSAYLQEKKDDLNRDLITRNAVAISEINKKIRIARKKNFSKTKRMEIKWFYTLLRGKSSRKLQLSKRLTDLRMVAFK